MDSAYHCESDTSESGNALYTSLLVCLVLVSIPIKNLAYLVPLVYLATQWYWGNRRLTQRTLYVLGFVFFASAASLFLDACRGQQVNIPGVAVGLLTFLSLVIVICERFDRKIDDILFGRLITLCSWFVILQSLVGIGQHFLSKNPDAISGTFGLFDFVTGEITIIHVFFTFTIYSLILFLASAANRPLPLIAILTGLLVTTLAHSAHQLIFFALSVSLMGALQFFRLRTFVSCAFLVVAVVFLVDRLFPETGALAEHWYAKVAENPDSPKWIVTEGGLEILGDWKNGLLGTGLGQYSSRAALITSNQYLTADLPSVLTGVSEYFWQYIRPAGYIYSDSGEGSAIAKPYYSLLSLAVELGLLQCLVLTVLIGGALVRGVRLMGSHRPEVGKVSLLANIGIVFFLLCCLVENYAEFPQALFVPSLLFVFANSRVRTLVRTKSSGVASVKNVSDSAAAPSSSSLHLSSTASGGCH